MNFTGVVAVHGIKPAIALAVHVPEAVGFCSLRTVTFDAEGRATITVLELTRDEASRLHDALGTALGREVAP